MAALSQEGPLLAELNTLPCPLFIDGNQKRKGRRSNPAA